MGSRKIKKKLKNINIIILILEIIIFKKNFFEI